VDSVGFSVEVPLLEHEEDDVVEILAHENQRTNKLNDIEKLK